MMTKAYTCLSGGVAAALRMGLHISSPRMREKFSSEEMFQRRRVFAHLNMLDTYVSSLVGLPRTTRDADQEQMVGLQDIDLTDNGRTFLAHSPASSIAETALLEKLCIIVGNIVTDRHPMLETGEAFVVDEPWDAAVELVSKREAELKEWHDALPVLPDTRADTRAIQGQLTLRLYCAMAQLVLYRPFVHHLSRRNSDPDFNLRGYEWGSACVKAAMQSIWLSEKFQIYNLFHEARWHMLYCLCFSATVLTYFVSRTTKNATVKESAATALQGRRMVRIRSYFFLTV